MNDVTLAVSLVERARAMKPRLRDRAAKVEEARVKLDDEERSLWVGRQ